MSLKVLHNFHIDLTAAPKTQGLICFVVQRAVTGEMT